MSGTGHGRLAVTPRMRHEITEDGGADCHYCGQPGVSEVDHVIPVALGGLTVPDNLVPACWLCNREKKARTVDEWARWRIERGRRWPPRDRWSATADLLMHPTVVTEHENGLAAAAERGALLTTVPRPVPFDEWMNGWTRRVHADECAHPDDEAVTYLDAVRASLLRGNEHHPQGRAPRGDSTPGRAPGRRRNDSAA